MIYGIINFLEECTLIDFPHLSYMTCRLISKCVHFLICVVHDTYCCGAISVYF
jgi:hypothetical protein